MESPTCVICGKNITYQFYLCNGCEADWGKRKVDWPEWLRYLVNQARRERYAAQRDKQRIEQVGLDDGLEELHYVEDWDSDRFR